MNHRTSFVLVSILSSALLYSQIGGTNAYIATDLVNSARVSALGGKFISVWDSDIDLGYANPALLDSTDTGLLAMNYGSLFSDVGNATVSYAYHRTGVGTFAASLNYLSYGEFTERDEFNTELGTFSAADYLLNLGYGRTIDSLFRVGANFKFIHSQLEQYNSSAIAVDLAGTYRSKNEDFTVGLVFRNVGVPLNSYREDNTESLPLGIDLGLTKRLSKSPLRLTLTFSDLQQWDLSYTDPADIGQVDPLTGEEIPIEEADIAEKILLHVNGSMEFLLGENFHLRLGYDFRRRNELALNDRPGGAGLSWGLGLKIAKMRLSYGRVIFNQAGATNHIGLHLRWADFRKTS
ncbi:MAG: type IX secretion system protein PorQ [Flavobacteriales bacterium]|nr:type IX secretion system protein PorQ [Flavobacteriales bacterium]